MSSTHTTYNITVTLPSSRLVLCTRVVEMDIYLHFFESMHFISTWLWPLKEGTVVPLLAFPFNYAWLSQQQQKHCRIICKLLPVNNIYPSPTLPFVPLQHTCYLCDKKKHKDDERRRRIYKTECVRCTLHFFVFPSVFYGPFFFLS